MDVMEPRPLVRFDAIFEPFSFGWLEDELFGADFYPRALTGSYPNIEVKEEKDHLLVTAELPGMTKDDIAVEVKNGVLTLSGEKKHERKEKREGYLYSERSYGSFRRSFRLADNVSEKDVNVSFKDGVMHISLKLERGKEPKRISVK
jgi:HSP20 family protein